MKHIPNLFTLLNLAFGCMAIIVVLQTGIVLLNTEDGSQLMSMPEQIFMASFFIGLAGLVDFLDGFVARLLKVGSEMGKQLDSLSDVISFGVAPGMIVYQFLRLSIAREQDGLNASIVWLLPALLIPMAAAWRLAKFNIDTTQTYHFRGVPTPAVGLLIASFPLIFWNNGTDSVIKLLLNKWLWYAVIVLLSYLMVSNIPIMGLKFKDYSFKNNMPKWILLAVAIVLIVLLKWAAVPFIFIAYILLSLPLKNKTAL